MREGCLLGILKKGMSSYSSPMMLIPRKLTGIPRIVTDFRHLNSRLVTSESCVTSLQLMLHHCSTNWIELDPNYLEHFITI